MAAVPLFRDRPVPPLPLLASPGTSKLGKLCLFIPASLLASPRSCAPSLMASLPGKASDWGARQRKLHPTLPWLSSVEQDRLWRTRSGKLCPGIPGKLTCEPSSSAGFPRASHGLGDQVGKAVPPPHPASSASCRLGKLSLLFSRWSHQDHHDLGCQPM